MSYDMTDWKDHVRQPENHYTETTNSDGSITHTPVGEVIQQGTPQSAANFNKMERGIFNATEQAAEFTRILLHQSQTLGKLKGDAGNTTLTNSLAYPFNNSVKTITLPVKRDTTDYEVEVYVTAANGAVGDVLITDKQVNGFKIAFTGSATSVTVRYVVTGGIY